MIMDVQLIDVQTCEPVPNTYVEFWQANQTVSTLISKDCYEFEINAVCQGVYSGTVGNGNGDANDVSNLNNTWLRAIQPTDNEGVVQVELIFPGHYGIDLASAWMERCSRVHKGFCYPQADVPLPTRLVYIPGDADQKLQLQATKGLVGRYVTLSYCWGDGRAFMTTSATFEDRKSGFEAGLLPQTLQDAIHTARKLGFHYIWVDALCIIQGDAVDWAHESSKMAEVYGRSSLTICADVLGKNEEGMFRTRDSICSHNFVCRLEVWDGERWLQLLLTILSV